MSQGIPEVITEGNTNYLYGLDLISSGQADVITLYYKGGLGSNKILTEINGGVTANYYYKAFGNLLSSSGTGGTSFKFAGEQNDDTGLIYLRARYYDPSTGRFTTRDPMPGGVENPASQNPYVYCLNSPLGLADPDGTAPIWKHNHTSTWQEAAVAILTVALVPVALEVAGLRALGARALPYVGSCWYFSVSVSESNSGCSEGFG